MSYRRVKNRKRKEGTETSKSKIAKLEDVPKPIYVRREVKWEKRHVWYKVTDEFLASTKELHTSIFEDDPSNTEISIERRVGYSGAPVIVKKQKLIPHSVAFPSDRNDRLLRYNLAQLPEEIIENIVKKMVSNHLVIDVSVVKYHFLIF